MKPKVFIGSSSEGLDVAYALQSNLDRDFEVTVWTQDVFRPTEFILEALLDELDGVDAGIFVFSPDDSAIVRGTEQSIVRDNVIFEFGLYIGRLGRDRCFMVAPRNGNPRLPSDLLGLSPLKYETRTDGRWASALVPASHEIRSALARLVPRLHRAPPELGLPILERRGLLSSAQMEILRAIETRCPVSREKLADSFPEMRAAELHYRLEQLRLLGFIVESGGQVGGGASSAIELHPLYAHVRVLRHLDTE